MLCVMNCFEKKNPSYTLLFESILQGCKQHQILPTRLLKLKKNSSLLAYKRAESMGRLDRAIVQEARKESNAPKLKSLLS